MQMMKMIDKKQDLWPRSDGEKSKICLVAVADQPMLGPKLALDCCCAKNHCNTMEHNAISPTL